MRVIVDDEMSRVSRGNWEFIPSSSVLWGRGSPFHNTHTHTIMPYIEVVDGLPCICNFWLCCYLALW